MTFHLTVMGDYSKYNHRVLFFPTQLYHIKRWKNSESHGVKLMINIQVFIITITSQIEDRIKLSYII